MTKIIAARIRNGLLTDQHSRHTISLEDAESMAAVVVIMPSDEINESTLARAADEINFAIATGEPLTPGEVTGL